MGTTIALFVGAGQHLVISLNSAMPAVRVKCKQDVYIQ